MKLFINILLLTLLSSTAFAGLCVIDKALYKNVDITKETMYHKISDAKTLAECRQKSLRGILRGTAIFRFTDDKKTSYYLSAGDVISVQAQNEKSRK